MQQKILQSMVDGHFSAQDNACAIAVALKIIDKKCQMDEASQALFMALYTCVIGRENSVFDSDIYSLIEEARQAPCLEILDMIHQQRLYAMEMLPKPIMKAFKQKVRSAIASKAEA